VHFVGLLFSSKRVLSTIRRYAQTPILDHYPDRCTTVNRVKWNVRGPVEATNPEETMRNGDAGGCVPAGKRPPANGRPHYWHPPTNELPRRWNILPGTCDYYVFGPLKDISTGRHFANGKKTKEATHADLVR